MLGMKAIEAMICLCIIDGTFHENEKAYLTDICKKNLNFLKVLSKKNIKR